MPTLPAASAQASPDLAPVLRVAEVRAVEAAALAAVPRPDLMARAGLAAAHRAQRLLAQAPPKPSHTGGQGQRVLVLAGPGNNGGDALVAACHLREAWLDVTVVRLGKAERLPPDAAAALAAWQAAGGTVQHSLPAPTARFDLIIDGLLGIGTTRHLDGLLADAVTWANTSAAAHGTPVLALDVPTGLCADTGQVLGLAIQASSTLTFIAHKPGLLTLDGPDHAGAVEVADLGLGPAVRACAQGSLLNHGVLRAALRPRPLNSHKGSHGCAGIVGGAPGMAGAVLLAARAALLAGSGRVYAGFLDPGAPALDANQPELMLHPAEQVLALSDAGQLDVLVCGPGLGTSAAARDALRLALGFKGPLLLDADALNLLATDEALQALVARRGAPTWLTPHPGEAARLLGTTTAGIAQDRVAAAVRLAQQFQATALLKGVGSIVAEPGGRWFVNASGNPGLAAAGMGDVLCGLAAALAAQGTPAGWVLPTAAHLHGLAADRLLALHGGPIGMTASEVAASARDVLNAAL
jgi:hydroxyethylthiazole kinase-like uncharacterized protein yjeF